ncbi:hypothetical protein IEQ34_011782 [Dendrobium chrysotoxum]|uniref:Uncharacterized protein n=1 Tax=Dendrobium chrysotoxum TaxID=161865 RepID=A0AAV7GTE3_DENCH|nr:hypothetical protein IEQ34_011782 [Dendrobium chrysotoxum]
MRKQNQLSGGVVQEFFCVRAWEEPNAWISGLVRVCKRPRAWSPYCQYLRPLSYTSMQMSLEDLMLEDEVKDIRNKLASPSSGLLQLMLLLDKAKKLLSRMEQSSSTSMLTAIQPAMKALIAKGHSDMDVKVFIESCVSEITRITMPDAPYHDDIMKEILG